MTAWEHLKALSSLTVGTAWAFLTHPKEGGTGVVINDGYQVEMTSMQVIAELEDSPTVTEIQDEGVTVELSTASIEVEVTE